MARGHRRVIGDSVDDAPEGTFPWSPYTLCSFVKSHRSVPERILCARASHERLDAGTSRYKLQWRFPCREVAERPAIGATAGERRPREPDGSLPSRFDACLRSRPRRGNRPCGPIRSPRPRVAAAEAPAPPVSRSCVQMDGCPPTWHGRSAKPSRTILSTTSARPDGPSPASSPSIHTISPRKPRSSSSPAPPQTTHSYRARGAPLVLLGGPLGP